jgi:ABC-type phosphate/phosphonate transport system ATPase subunit
MTRKNVDYAKRYRDRATEMRALSEIMTHPKTKLTMLKLAHDYDNMADRALEHAAGEVTTGPSPTPKNG